MMGIQSWRKGRGEVAELVEGLVGEQAEEQDLAHGGRCLVIAIDHSLHTTLMGEVEHAKRALAVARGKVRLVVAWVGYRVHLHPTATAQLCRVSLGAGQHEKLAGKVLQHLLRGAGGDATLAGFPGTVTPDDNGIKGALNTSHLAGRHADLPLLGDSLLYLRNEPVPHSHPASLESKLGGVDPRVGVHGENVIKDGVSLGDELLLPFGGDRGIGRHMPRLLLATVQVARVDRVLDRAEIQPPTCHSEHTHGS
jgi:hypothetical protein